MQHIYAIINIFVWIILNITYESWSALRNVEVGWEMLKCAEKCWSALRNVEVRWEMLKCAEKCWSVLWNVEVRYEMLKCDVKFWGAHFLNWENAVKVDVGAFNLVLGNE